MNQIFQPARFYIHCLHHLCKPLGDLSIAHTNLYTSTDSLSYIGSISSQPHSYQSYQICYPLLLTNIDVTALTERIPNSYLPYHQHSLLSLHLDSTALPLNSTPNALKDTQLMANVLLVYSRVSLYLLG